MYCHSGVRLTAVVDDGGVAGVTVTVKTEVAVPLPAVTVMVWAPVVALDGTVTILVKLPPLSVCVLPVGVSVVVSNLKTRAVLAGKLEPLTVTLVPARPEAGERGLRVALMPVTVKLAVAVPLPTVTVMVWAPAVLCRDGDSADKNPAAAC